MAEPTRAIFNEKAMNKLRSPDDLDRYVRVTNPSVWIILAACLAFLAGLLVWGVFGAVTTSVSTMAAREGNEVICFLSAEDASKVHVGDAASVSGVRVTVGSISETPLSRGEVTAELSSDYLVDSLVDDNWSYVVRFEGDVTALPSDVPLDATITVERVAPLSLVLGGQA